MWTYTLITKIVGENKEYRVRATYHFKIFGIPLKWNTFLHLRNDVIKGCSTCSRDLLDAKGAILNHINQHSKRTIEQQIDP